MQMRRDVLKLTLSAGPSRRLDVNAITCRQTRAGRGGELLFNTGALNRALLLKRTNTGPGGRPVSTVVYLPFDPVRPDQGGQSFVFSEASFLAHCYPNGSSERVGDQAVRDDLRKLEILDGAPTFNPFIVDLAFVVHDVTVPRGMLELSPQLQTKLREHLHVRIRALLVAALRGSPADINRLLAEMTDKLARPRECTAVLPIVRALRPGDDALETYAAWLAIALYELELVALHPALGSLRTWLATCVNTRERLGAGDREELTAAVRDVRERVERLWNGAVEVSMEYQRCCEDLAFRSSVKSFAAFLANAPAQYWLMGDSLGRLEQAVHAANQYTSRYDDRRLTYRELREFLDLARAVL